MRVSVGAFGDYAAPWSFAVEGAREIIIEKKMIGARLVREAVVSLATDRYPCVLPRSSRARPIIAHTLFGGKHC